MRARCIGFGPVFDGVAVVLGSITILTNRAVDGFSNAIDTRSDCRDSTASHRARRPYDARYCRSQSVGDLAEDPACGHLPLFLGGSFSWSKLGGLSLWCVACLRRRVGNAGLLLLGGLGVRLTTSRELFTRCWACLRPRRGWDLLWGEFRCTSDFPGRW